MASAICRVRRLAADSDHAVNTDSMMRLTIAYSLFTLCSVISIIQTFALPNADIIQTILDVLYLVLQLGSQLMLLVILNDLISKIANSSNCYDEENSMNAYLMCRDESEIEDSQVESIREVSYEDDSYDIGQSDGEKSLRD